MVLKKIALTGAGGMLGRHTVAAMEQAGIQVIPVTRTHSGETDSRSWNLAAWFSHIELDRVFAGADAVVHAGALVPCGEPLDDEALFNTNVRACLNLGQWAIARRIPIVHVSSAAVYADPEAAMLNEDSILGANMLGGAYGFSKLMAEDVMVRLRQQGLQAAIVRPSSLYGCGLAAGNLVSKFLSAANQDKAIELTPPVTDGIDFIHAADLASAVVAILRKQAWDTFNISTGKLSTIEELATSCVSVAGRGHVLVGSGNSSTRAPITRFALNNTRARQVLEWQPEVTLSQGLGMMLCGRYSALS